LPEAVTSFAFSGNLKDQSPNQSHGEGHALWSFGTDRFGRPNEALSLSTDSPGYISVRNPKFPSGVSQRTISLWFQANPERFFQTGPNSRAAALLSFGPWNASQPGLVMFLSYENQTNLVPSASAEPTGNYVFGVRRPDNQWHHLVFTYANRTGNLYFDGALLKSGDIPVETYTEELQIGREHGGWRQFDGLLDDIRIYNRTVSGEEVRALYSEVPPPDLHSAGLFVGFTVSGVAGKTYLIQHSPDSTSPVWTTLTHLTLTNSQQTWVDTSATASARSRGFYRAVPP
jgi:hypothetical protein